MKTSKFQGKEGGILFGHPDEQYNKNALLFDEVFGSIIVACLKNVKPNNIQIDHWMPRVGKGITANPQEFLSDFQIRFWNTGDRVKHIRLNNSPPKAFLSQIIRSTGLAAEYGFDLAQIFFTGLSKKGYYPSINLEAGCPSIHLFYGEDNYERQIPWDMTFLSNVYQSSAFHSRPFIPGKGNNFETYPAWLIFGQKEEPKRKKIMKNLIAPVLKRALR